MLATVLAASLGFVAPALHAPEIRYFPGREYEGSRRERLEQRALARWPGPTGLLRLWQSGELEPEQQVALLLGGGAFHDPQLLPAYYQGLGADNPRVRQAAAYGFRVLLGDLVPDLRRGLSETAAAALQQEVAAVAVTLRLYPLSEIWLNSLLTTEKHSFPGYEGVILKRSRRDCLFALETVLTGYDLELLVQAYGESTQLSNRIALMQLIEGFSLQRFLVLATGAKAAWGMRDYERGLASLDAWIDEWFVKPCGFDRRRMLMESFSQMQAPRLDPFEPEGCELWKRVLLRGDHSWWAQAAQQLYHCGGPPIPLAVLTAERQENVNRRDQLLSWYGMK